MIAGSCPYCDGYVSNPIAPITPCWQRCRCDSCRKTYWLYHSRIEPAAYTEEGFKKEFELNEKDRTVKAYAPGHAPKGSKA